MISLCPPAPALSVSSFQVDEPHRELEVKGWQGEPINQLTPQILRSQELIHVSPAVGRPSKLPHPGAHRTGSWGPEWARTRAHTPPHGMQASQTATNPGPHACLALLMLELRGLLSVPTMDLPAPTMSGPHWAPTPAGGASWGHQPAANQGQTQRRWPW